MHYYPTPLTPSQDHIVTVAGLIALAIMIVVPLIVLAVTYYCELKQWIRNLGDE